MPVTNALTYELTDENAHRVTVYVREVGDTYNEICDIFESDCPDTVWDVIALQYPNVNAVLVGNDFIDADCLSIREAAEAAFS